MKDNLNEKILDGELLESVSGGGPGDNRIAGSKFKVGDYVKIAAVERRAAKRYCVDYVHLFRGAFEYGLKDEKGMPLGKIYLESELEYWYS